VSLSKNEWSYLVEEVSTPDDGEEIKVGIERQVQGFAAEGWEPVSSWSIPGNPQINNGAWRVYMLFKRPKYGIRK
jgi:hypothetical protein